MCPSRLPAGGGFHQLRDAGAVASPAWREGGGTVRSTREGRDVSQWGKHHTSHTSPCFRAGPVPASDASYGPSLRAAQRAHRRLRGAARRQGGGLPGLGQGRQRRRAPGPGGPRPPARAHALQGHRAPRARGDCPGRGGPRRGDQRLDVLRPDRLPHRHRQPVRPRWGWTSWATRCAHSAFDAEELAREIEVVCEEIKRSQDTPSRRASRRLVRHRLPGAPLPASPSSAPRRACAASPGRRCWSSTTGTTRPKNLVLVGGGRRDARRRCAQWVEEHLRRGLGPALRGPGAARRRAAPPRAAALLLREDDVKEALPPPELRHPPGGPRRTCPRWTRWRCWPARAMRRGWSLEVKRKLSLVNDDPRLRVHAEGPGPVQRGLTLPPANAAQALRARPRGRWPSCAPSRCRRGAGHGEGHHRGRGRLPARDGAGHGAEAGLLPDLLGGLEAEERYYEAVAELTPEDMREVAERYLRFEARCVTGLLPAGHGLHRGPGRGAPRRGGPRGARRCGPSAACAGPRAPRPCACVRRAREHGRDHPGEAALGRDASSCARSTGVPLFADARGVPRRAALRDARPTTACTTLLAAASPGARARATRRRFPS